MTPSKKQYGGHARYVSMTMCGGLLHDENLAGRGVLPGWNRLSAQRISAVVWGFNLPLRSRMRITDWPAGTFSTIHTVWARVKNQRAVKCLWVV